MENAINDYISREIVQDPAMLPLSNETSLLEGGILDSLSLLRLVIFIEEQFKITVGEADLLSRELRQRECHLFLPPGAGAGEGGGRTRVRAARGGCAATGNSGPGTENAPS